jgi:hypothetical protein
MHKILYNKSFFLKWVQLVLIDKYKKNMDKYLACDLKDTGIWLGNMNLAAVSVNKT